MILGKIFAFIGDLVLYPLMAAIVLLVAKAIADRVFDPGVRKWEAYLWLLLVGFVLFHYRTILREIIPSGE